MSVVRPSQVRLPCPLEQGAEGDVVDQRALDLLQAAGRLQRGPADEHAAARRGRGPAPRVVDPAERVELGEEVDEGGHDHPLPAGFRPQQGHLRDQRPVVRLRRRDQVAQRVRGPGDVGVGEQHVLRRGPPACRPAAVRPASASLAAAAKPCAIAQTLPAQPSGRGLAADDRQRRAAVPGGLLAQFGRDRAGAVVAVVVDQENPELARVILGEQRGERLWQRFRLVPRGHDGGDRRHGQGGPALTCRPARNWLATGARAGSGPALAGRAAAGWSARSRRARRPGRPRRRR